MATTEEEEFKALIMDSSKVVSAAKVITKKNKLSRKNREKFGKLGLDSLDVSASQKKKEFIKTVEKPLVTSWNSAGSQGPPVAVQSDGVKPGRRVKMPLAAPRNIDVPPGPSLVGQSDRVTNTLQSVPTAMIVERPQVDDSVNSSESEYGSADQSDTASEMDRDSVLQGMPPIQQAGAVPQFYLQGKPVPQPVFETQLWADRMEAADAEDFQSRPHVKPRRRKKVLVPDTPIKQTQESLSCAGEVPETPLSGWPKGKSPYSLIPEQETGDIAVPPENPVVPDRGRQEVCPAIMSIVHRYEAEFPTAYDRMRNIGYLLGDISAQFEAVWGKIMAYVDLERRLEKLEAVIAAPTFAQVVKQPTPLVQDHDVDILGRSGATEHPRVPHKRKKQGSPDKIDVVVAKQPEAVQQPRVVPVGVSEPTMVPRPPAPKLPPPGHMPVLVVRPLVESITSSAQLKALLESKLHPQTLQVDIIVDLLLIGEFLFTYGSLLWYRDWKRPAMVIWS
ncbi:hypothetical protein AVEN_93073-1 [Araneus ventricosus]|uniref:Uncharacterized protein n=2 Tax=Araneus ventricosus TaxID=182803 RepID=A0A4Y2S9Z1_ARAVE|nr:hypothetical protein AVEN_93073-1 [Araneus ventricosus]